MQNAERNLFSAFKTRWEYGKAIFDNYDLIINEFGSQKRFAEYIGHSEAVVSNNKRGYENLLKENCNDWYSVESLLKEKSIRPTIRNFEKIGTLLNEPTSDTKPKDQIPKDRRRLEELMEEVRDIIKRNESGNNIELAEDATEFLEDIEDIQNYLNIFDVFKHNFTSEKYLNYIRNYGFDIVTGEPCERCDPHHVGNNSNKRNADLLTIPVSRKTHNLLHLGVIEMTEREVNKYLIQVMSNFIQRVL